MLEYLSPSIQLIVLYPNWNMSITNKEVTTSEPGAAAYPPLGGGGAARLAFKMKLFPGKEAEYKKRHDEIWPELQGLLKEAGISEYSIFLDEETNSLFGVLKVTDPQNLNTLPKQEVMQRWWRYMADIMEANPDNSPVSIPLKEVFYLP
jgi:L-rhamnose mutarotase